MGTVQATLSSDGSGDDERTSAELAWVVGTPWQGRGYASPAATTVAAWLVGQGVAVLTACVHPRHAASNAVARACGLAPSDARVDGEVVWRSSRRA